MFFVNQDSILLQNEFIEGIDYFLKKDEHFIPYKAASSGEIHQISTLFYIASNIDEKTVILIDEPENSLHPRWQKDFSKKILDLFALYSPSVVVATHSPLLISSSNKESEQCQTYLVKNFALTPLPINDNDLESLVWNLFGVVTPQSNFLSRYLVNMMNDLDSNVITLDDVQNRLDEFRHACYDDEQRRIFDEIQQMATEMVEDRL